MLFLTLPVDDRLTEGYNSSSAEEKDLIKKVMGDFLDKLLKEKHKADFLKSLETSVKEAERNGLTREKLADIMEWDEVSLKNLFRA